MDRNSSTAFLKVILLIGTIVLSGCKTTSTLTKDAYLPEGYQLFQGETQNKKVTWHCVKIDLDTPDLALEILPDQENYKSDYLQNTAKKHNAVIAINTSPYTSKKKVVGVTKTNNREITPPNQRYAALCFSEEPLRAHIVNSQTEEALNCYPFATGGFFTIIDQGQIITFKKFKHSRTAAGTSDQGRFLYLFAASPKFNLADNDGMTFEDCAEILLELGCDNALQFDSGHSTGLYLNGRLLEKPFPQRKVPAVLIIK